MEQSVFLYVNWRFGCVSVLAPPVPWFSLLSGREKCFADTAIQHRAGPVALYQHEFLPSVHKYTVKKDTWLLLNTKQACDPGISCLKHSNKLASKYLNSVLPVWPELTSLMRCLTGLWPPPTPHTLSRRIISLFMVSSTAARSKATLREKQPTKTCLFGNKMSKQDKSLLLKQTALHSCL